jgi:hypothetical protein
MYRITMLHRSLSEESIISPPIRGLAIVFRLVCSMIIKIKKR